jgi:hypothetical protein
VVLVPAALIAGAAPGTPREGERWSWRLAAPNSRATGRVLVGAFLTVCGVALVVSAAAGVQWYRADLAFAAFARGAPPSEGERAAELWRWEPFYGLQTGAHLWREGLASEDDAALGYADLARLELSQGSISGSVDQLRRGLRWNSSHPVLQGPWGYSALTARTTLEDLAEADRLLSALRAQRIDTPDAGTGPRRRSRLVVMTLARPPLRRAQRSWRHGSVLGDTASGCCSRADVDESANDSCRMLLPR